MSIAYQFARKWLPCVIAFMLFACGGGGDNDPTISGTSDTVTAAESTITNNVSSAANNVVTEANSTLPENVFIAVLGADQVVSQIVPQVTPFPRSTAIGIGVVMIDPPSSLMRATLTTAGITGISANIHIAPTGVEGPIAFSLTEVPLGSGVWSTQAILTDEQITALRSGNYYFSVRSTAFPAGEIRGQIVPQLPVSGITVSIANSGNDGIITSGAFGTITPDATGVATGNNAPIGIGSTPGAIAQRTAFVNVLTGTQQVPPTSSNAVAIGVAIVDVDSQALVSSITSMGISGLSAHIHQAPAGSNGDTVFALNETAVGSGIWASRFSLSILQRTALVSGDYYFDIHTAAFPNGEIRGQIVPTGRTDTTGIIGTGSTGIVGTTPRGITTTPFVPVTGTGITGSTPTDITGGSVPTFGNPVGSGIGSASDFTDTGVATFGNPAGSGIGSGTSTPFISTPASSPSAIGVDMNTVSNTGSTDGFGTSSISNGGFGTSSISNGGFGTPSINTSRVVGFATIPF